MLINNPIHSLKTNVAVSFGYEEQIRAFLKAHNTHFQRIQLVCIIYKGWTFQLTLRQSPSDLWPQDIQIATGDKEPWCFHHLGTEFGYLWLNFMLVLCEILQSWIKKCATVIWMYGMGKSGAQLTAMISFGKFYLPESILFNLLGIFNSTKDKTRTIPRTSVSIPGSGKNVTLLARYCKEHVPRSCDHFMLANATRFPRPCSLSESFLSSGDSLTLELKLSDSTAIR